MTNFRYLRSLFLETRPLFVPDPAKKRATHTNDYLFYLIAPFTDRGRGGLNHLVGTKITVLHFVKTIQTILRHDIHLVYLVFPMVHMI